MTESVPVSAAYRAFGTFRLFLAMLVVISHANDIAPEWVSALVKPWNLGNLGVMLFFVVSGFVITEACFVFYRNRPGAFLLNRALRIFPPFYIALLFSIGVHYLVFRFFGGPLDAFFSISNIAKNFLSMPALYGGSALGLFPDHPFISFYWAISVELHFYLTAILAYSLLWRLSGVSEPEKLRRLFWAASFCTVMLLSCGWNFFGSRVFYYFSFAPYFVAGISLYFMADRGCTAGNVVSFMVSMLFSVVHFSTHPSRGTHVNVIGPAVLFVLLVGLFFFLSTVRLSGKKLHWDRFWGELSYPLYLNHFVVFMTFMYTLEKTIPNYFFGIFVAMILSIGMRYLTEPLTETMRTRIRGTKL